MGSTHQSETEHRSEDGFNTPITDREHRIEDGFNTPVTDSEHRSVMGSTPQPGADKTVERDRFIQWLSLAQPSRTDKA